MEPATITVGAIVTARNAFGQENHRRALSPVVQGGDFPVVWICSEEEWRAAEAEGRPAEGVPWPAEDIRVGQLA